MNRYESPTSLRKQGIKPSNPTLFSTPTKSPYKLSIPNLTHPDFSRTDIQESFDRPGQGKSNQLLTFKPQQSCTSNINPFSELYFQSNNVTENQDLNASIAVPVDFENVLDSDCSMEIPNERFQDSICLKHFSYKEEDPKPLLLITESDITNKDIVTVSKEGKAFFTEPISPPQGEPSFLFETKMSAFEEKNTTPQRKALPRKVNNKVKSVTKRKHYEGVLDGILQREKENRDQSPALRIQTCGSPSTPRLGRSPLNTSGFLQQRNKSRCDERKRSRDTSMFIGEDAKENLKKFTLNLEEANREKEYLKVYVHQLKSLIKKEQDEIIRLGKNVKGIENNFQKLNLKQIHAEKQGIDIKDQLQKTKEEVLKYLEGVDANRKNLEPLIERINQESENLENAKTSFNALKITYVEMMREKEKQKQITLNSRKAKQRIITAFESLERKNLNYIQTIELHLTEDNEN